MNNLVFTTGGDWNSTTLANDGQEVLAAQLFVEMHSGRDGFNEPSGNGIFDGGELNAVIRPQEDPSQEIGVFPGRLEMNFPGHAIVIENVDPVLSFTATRVWFDARDVTDRIMDVYVDINAVDNVVRASITLYRPHWFTADEVATIDLL